MRRALAHWDSLRASLRANEAGALPPQHRVALVQGERAAASVVAGQADEGADLYSCPPTFALCPLPFALLISSITASCTAGRTRAIASLFRSG